MGIRTFGQGNSNTTSRRAALESSTAYAANTVNKAASTASQTQIRERAVKNGLA
ncbi:hypothetical protein EJ02DRAFT_459341, partial [Clathrospora elynae]